MSLPDCGLFQTTIQIGGVPPGQLVYFHNHGDPGPGIYLPERWQNNRAVFSKRGTTLDEPGLADTLEPLSPEGLYRVRESFTCCAKNCRTFESGLLVQLGYNGQADPLLFVPRWTDEGLMFPEKGFRLDEGKIDKIEQLDVEVAPPAPQPEALQ